MNAVIQAYSIKQFCEVHSISRAKFYLMLGEGTAPLLMKVGKRRLISVEAASAWRKLMETEQVKDKVQHGS